MKKIRIEDKPIWCNAWCSKSNDNVMCNSIPCCGFNMHGETDRVVKGFDHTGIGKHPLVNGLFYFGDGEFKKETPK